jgi:hypothetical protein
VPVAHLLNAERRTCVAIAWAWMALLLVACLGSLANSSLLHSPVAAAVYGSGADQALNSAQRLVVIGDALKQAHATGGSPFLLASHDLRCHAWFCPIADFVGTAPHFAWRYTSSAQPRAPPQSLI